MKRIIKNEETGMKYICQLPYITTVEIDDKGIITENDYVVDSSKFMEAEEKKFDDAKYLEVIQDALQTVNYENQQYSKIKTTADIKNLPLELKENSHINVSVYDSKMFLLQLKTNDGLYEKHFYSYINEGLSSKEENQNNKRVDNVGIEMSNLYSIASALCPQDMLEKLILHNSVSLGEENVKVLDLKGGSLYRGTIDKAQSPSLNNIEKSNALKLEQIKDFASKLEQKDFEVSPIKARYFFEYNSIKEMDTSNIADMEITDLTEYDNVENLTDSAE